MKRVDVVGAVIRNAQGAVLCAKRSEQMSLPGYWEFPGGKIEPGEDPKDTLRREIREELGCEIEVQRLVADTEYAYPGILARLQTFEAHITDGVPLPKEHEQLLWLPVSAISDLHWAPADVPTVRALLAES